MFIKLGRFEVFGARDWVVPANAKRPRIEIIRHRTGGLDVRMLHWRAVFSWSAARRTVVRRGIKM